MSERSRASSAGVIAGLLGIATLVAAAGLFIRQYTRDRREIWLLNPAERTAVVYVDGRRHTLLAGEIAKARAPRARKFRVGIKLDGQTHTLSVLRDPQVQEALIVDAAPGAAYAVLDMTPRYAGNGTPARRRLAADGRSFRPEVIAVRGPGSVIKLPGGAGHTIGPKERLPPAVWLARKYGHAVYKIMRVPAPVDPDELQSAVERALADRRALVELELAVTSTASTPTRP